MSASIILLFSSVPIVIVLSRKEEYALETVECDQELGRITLDSIGAENAGQPAIDISRIAGGDISHRIRLGHTAVRLKACYDVHGTYTHCQHV